MLQPLSPFLSCIIRPSRAVRSLPITRQATTSTSPLAAPHISVRRCAAYRHRTLRSGISLSSLAITAAACAATTGSVLVYTATSGPAPAARVACPTAPTLVEDHMAPTLQPGRPGSLTVDQEAKLQELWRRVLEVFGVATIDPVGAAGAEAAPEEPEVNGIAKTDTGLTADKKKKRRSLFSRKRKESKSEDSKAAAAPPAVPEAEDKYGQTKEYHTALAENAPEELRRAFWDMVKGDHPDALLLRFLRARKWDVDKALVMLVSTMQWRAREMHVDDDVVPRGEGGALADAGAADAAARKEGEDFLAQCRLGKSFLRGTDREGRPLCVVRVRLHRQGEQTERSLERFTVHVLETARLLLLPPVDTATVVFDMTGFALANMDYTPVKFMIKCFEANYPESLGVVLVHRAPWVFQGIWKIIKGWLDPVVAGKVHFTNSPAELEHYIARERIIKELGGDDPWEYAYVEPREGENAAQEDAAARDRLQKEREGVVREYEALTRKWVTGAPTDESLMAERNEIAERLRSGYWGLDPYVRARSLLDRTGVIGKDGRIDFYPSTSEKVEPAKEASSGTTASGPAEAPAHVHSNDDVD